MRERRRDFWEEKERNRERKRNGEGETISRKEVLPEE